MDILRLPLQIGWSMFTGLDTLSCAGCRQSLQNGLAKICKRRWDFLTRQIGERAREQGGHLNHILEAHVVDEAFTTFSCVEWESELFLGVMRARCYPFNMPKHHFHGFNPQVYIHYN